MRRRSSPGPPRSRSTGAAPATRVFEDETVVAFLDVRPLARGHTLVVPRTHAARLDQLAPADGAAMFRTAQRLSRALTRSDLAPDGTNLVLNDGRAAFQTVGHAHLHVLPRWRGDTVLLAARLVRRRPHAPDAIAAQIRTGLDRLEAEDPR